MLRHTMTLQNAVLVAAKKPVPQIKGRWPTEGWQTLRHPAGHNIRFRVALGTDVLEIAGEIVEPKGWQRPPVDLHPEWWFREHVVLFLDPAHDHATRRMIAVLRDGQVHTEDVWHMVGEEIADVLQKKIGLPPLRQEVRVAKTVHGWRMLARIKRRRLLPAGLDGKSLGLHLRFGTPGDVMQPAVCWPSADPGWSDNPFSFGDVLENGAKLLVSGVDFGKPVWKTGEATSSIRITGALGKHAPRCGICQIGVVQTDGRRTTTTHEWKSVRNRLAMNVPVDYPFTSKWAPDILKTARVEIAILNASKKPLWQAAYPFGFDAGIIVREPFGQLRKSVAGARRPLPDDPAFVGKYRAWLLRNLPDWQWRTTRQKAPSDFYLRAQQRADDIDLMSPTVMRDLAQLIHRRFDDWQDGLCAVSMILHHPCLTVHSASWARIAGAADNATVLRLGGCFCGDTARLAAQLAEELGRLYRQPLKGFTLGLRGHLSGLVETPIGDVLVDPMLGIYYHTLDNRRLATLDEMRADAAIAKRMWALPYATDGAPFFHGVRNQVKRPWRDATLVYPPG
jgi:hypothetical protein